MMEQKPKILPELKGVPRDEQIVICYKAGNCVADLAAAFNLSSQRIMQILARKKVTRDDNPVTRNRKLYAFIGVNVTNDTKLAIVAAAKKKHMSLSSYIAFLIQQHLDEASA